MDLKIGGIYTADKLGNQGQVAIIINNKNDDYISYYMLKILADFTKNDIEKIVEDQIRFNELKIENFNSTTAHFLSFKIDGYMGQMSDNILFNLS